MNSLTKEKKQHYFSFKRKYLCIPYGVFLVLFIIIPIFLIIFYAFTDANGSFSFESLVGFFTTWTKINVLFVSAFVALQTTLICLLIGYPLAYFLADKKINKNAVLVTLFIAPMWINFVLRTGATRDLLTWFGINGGTNPYLATLIGMVYNYLPFVILPLYTTMIKLDKSQIEAAADLGANPAEVFFKNIVPQSFPGIVSAILMTFMPTMSSYVISDVLSEGKITLFGNYIYLDFSTNAWNDGSFMALIMLAIVGISMFLTRNTEKDTASRGGGLW
ncbi:MAG: ABC transporter permease [Erysipelotrichaceae bacterium]|nr:ABC transporter permease [Erysipelotrichaceae bacterium]